MVNRPTTQSTYADFVYTQIELLYQQGKTEFTVKELAEFAGLKVTHNLRRRLQHAVEAGTLGCFYAIGEKRGSHLVYYKPGFHPTIGELPF